MRTTMADRGMISLEDLEMLLVTDEVNDAVKHILESDLSPPRGEMAT
jgi:hypothetical protein